MADELAKRKIARVAYWYRRLRDARRRVLDTLEPVSGVQLDPEAEHPRILEAVKEIEFWTGRGEKVLVFGVFLRPLQLLMHVLNVRHALSVADKRMPLPHSLVSNPVLLGIAHRQWPRMRKEGLLTGRLATDDWGDVRRALRESHKAYKNLRGRVRKAVKACIKTWRADPSLLGGVPRDGDLDSALEDRLVTFVVDDYLRISASAKPEGNAPEPADRSVEELAKEFRRDYIAPLLRELDDPAVLDGVAHPVERADADGGEESASAKRQTILREEFVKPKKPGKLDDSDNRQSLHARFLHGETKWGTRRHLQAAFNRHGASPWVLIAQSQVGREGLNLHESCRMVVQFHAEWNPAVLEQQIGRVDRKGSLWEKSFEQWWDGKGDLKFIEVRQLMFEGTYDAFQWESVMRRQHVFDASLFCFLLPGGAWERVPEAQRTELIESAPIFSPLPQRRR
jgi:hypothetical protein